MQIQDFKQLEYARDLVKNPNFLIVEDDSTIEPIWDYIVHKINKDARYDWAASEPEADYLIEKAAENGTAYDLIVSDIMLAGHRTGFDLWQKYRDQFRGKIALISGMDYSKVIQYIGNTQSSPLLLRKPIHPNECIKSLSGLLYAR